MTLVLQADITLRGYSGYNTRWVLETLETNFPLSLGSSAFQLATVWFGANDAALPDKFKYCPALYPLNDYASQHWPSISSESRFSAVPGSMCPCPSTSRTWRT